MAVTCEWTDCIKDADFVYRGQPQVHFCEDHLKQDLKNKLINISDDEALDFIKEVHKNWLRINVGGEDADD